MVKRRHVLTRRNRLRLRYSVLPVLFVTLSFSAAFSFPSPDSVDVSLQSSPQFAQASLAAVEPAAGGAGIAMLPDEALERYETRQKRLSRYLPDETDAMVMSPVKNHEQVRVEEMIIDRGDTLSAVLLKAGLNNKEAFFASKEMEKHLDPKYIRPGQKISVTYHSDDGDGFHFQDMKVMVDPLKSIRLARVGEDGFKSDVLEKKAIRQLYAQAATIETSLYGSAAKAGIPVSVIADAIHIYSWDVDFQRDIRQGDKISVMYERYETEEGLPVKNGNILYASLTVNGNEIPLYRFETKNGDTDYFKPNGSSARKTLMKTPIDGARVSSGYGMRHHPVLGYNKMHKGVDFSAPRGTPIYAAGDGIIEKASRYGAYGNYVRIRHNGSLKTAYAHMNGFGKGITSGKRVKQGQVIGYVGTTGRSTGPHLHYEVLKDGSQSNPAKLKLPQGETLKGEQLTLLQDYIKTTNSKYSALLQDKKYVSAE